MQAKVRCPPKELVVLALLLVGLSAVLAVPQTALAASTTGKVTYIGPTLSDAGNLNPSGTVAHSKRMEITVDGVARLAICVEHEKTSPAKGKNVSRNKIVTNSDMRRIMYYGYGGPADTGQYGLVRTATAMSAANGHMVTTKARAMINALRKLAAPPSAFVVEMWTTGKSADQMLCTGRMQMGTIKLQKREGASGYLAEVAGSTLKGAKYNVYNSAGKLVRTLTTDANGNASVSGLWVDTYKIKETAASYGFSLDPKAYTVKVTDGGTATVASKEPPLKGGVSISKASSDPSITDASAYYSLAEAVYDVINSAGRTVTTITTSASGAGQCAKTLWPGTYIIKESKAPQGFELDLSTYTVTITIADCIAGKTAHLDVEDVPKTATVRFYVDGDASPIHSATWPLGFSLAKDEPEMGIAAGKAAKPNCTPGLDAWYYSSSYSSKFTEKTLYGDLNLYARNIATVTYALAAGSSLTEDFPMRSAMSESSPELDVLRDVLPPSRQADWGGKIVLKEPRLKTVFYHDGRWRTLRWLGEGWYPNAAATGDTVKTLTVLRDATVYGDWSRSTYDGIYSW